ncbi:MAG: SDR family NAD(P)-dependent oxidoreductase, partial [Chloroflexi bacterium]|nr:SDR family NAD(P)-dependent oxidoreductase [Chloroflexota bacterium]
MGEFDGKSVIVTGGALGIGGGASEAFAGEGANVTILDWNVEAGEAIVDRIMSAPTTAGKAQFVHGDAGT